MADPRHINVRLDDETLAALQAYKDQNEMTTSQAVRMLLALALRDEKSVDVAFRRAAFKEGVSLGVARIREKFTTSVEQAVGDALGELDTYGG